ncbi:hypothetical protein APR04_000083 [Promicromonospora umidemergens]|nr:hypothetical protein [Promicromonospora umidemergens]
MLRARPGHRIGYRTVTAGPTAAASAQAERHPTASSGRGHRTCRERLARQDRGPGEHSVHRTGRTDPAGGRAARELRTDGSRTGWAAGHPAAPDRPASLDPAGPVHPGRDADQEHQAPGHPAQEHDYQDRTAGHRGPPCRTAPRRAGPDRAPRNRTAAEGCHRAAARASDDRSRPHRASHPSPAAAEPPAGSAATNLPQARARHGAAPAARPAAGKHHRRYRHHQRRPRRQPHARESRGASWDDPCCHSS